MSGGRQKFPTLFCGPCNLQDGTAAVLSTLAWTAADRLDPGPSGKLPPGAINARRWTARCPLCGYAELYTQDGLGRLFKDQDDDHERRRAGLTRAAWADRARGLDDTDGG